MQAIILAAGKGIRMKDDSLPKVMFPLLGKPLIQYSVDHVREAGVKDIILVVGYKKEKVQEYFGRSVKYAFQEQQLGTGHAVMAAGDQIDQKMDWVLVCYGDMPLYQSDTIRKLIQAYHSQHPTIAMLTVNFNNPNFWAYGRIVRDAHQNILGIVEQKDCTPAQREIKESNPGFYVFEGSWLKENLSQLKTNNAQKEYYLTDLVEMAVKQQRKVVTVPVSEESEALGINTPEQLKQAEEILHSH